MNQRAESFRVQQQIEAQIELAHLATVDDIRAMHRDLEALYRTQLVALLLAERLACSQIEDQTTDINCDGYPACNSSTSSNEPCSHRSWSSRSKMTGMALGCLGATIGFGSVVQNA